MEFDRKHHNHVHINIAPLVDVVFLLLLFFMLTSHLMQEPAIRIKLPESKTSETKNETINTIFISKNGEIYYQNSKVTLGNLQEAIIGSLQNPEKDFLRIKADKDVNVGLLVSVIDEVRLSGVKNFSILTERQ